MEKINVAYLKKGYIFYLCVIPQFNHLAVDYWGVLEVSSIQQENQKMLNTIHTTTNTTIRYKDG